MAGDAIHFRRACGLLGPLRATIHAQRREEAVQKDIDQPFALIGRHPAADVVLDDENVSRYHAYLQIINGHPYCLDLESRVGTHWERGADNTGWLDFEQATEIGPFHVLFSGSPSQNGAEPGASLPDPLRSRSDERSLPNVELEFVDIGQAQPIWQMRPVLALIGKSPRCKIQLVHASIARFHCSLLRTAQGLWVVSLRGDTLVNQTPVRFARLENGDRLQVGKFTIQVHCSPAAAVSRLPVPAFAKSQLQTIPADLGGPLAVSPHFAPPMLSSDTVVTGSTLIHFLNQFSLAQQQMFSQQQQTLMILLRMLDLMHRDTKGAIREELDHLQQITQELCSLQAQYVSLTSRQSQSLAAPAPKPSAEGRRPAEKPPVAEPEPAGIDELLAPLAADEDPETAHSWLVERMATLGREQETSWQKLFGFLRGK